MILNLTLPTGWLELSDKHLRYVYKLLAAELSADEIKTLCLLFWSGTKVIGRQPDGSWLLRNGKSLFNVKPIQIAELLHNLDWLMQLPPYPVRLRKLHPRKPLPADFAGVPFETFVICDNLYQGYLMTQNDLLLDQLAAVLYRGSMKLSDVERVSVFYWFASLKDMLSHKFPDFFQPVADSSTNLLGPTHASVEAAMNAQIRALTKGDITKEKEVLSLDTHRALTELDAQAREYKEMKSVGG